MFEDCNSLRELNLSNFNMTNVTIMDRMFYKIGSYQNQGTKLVLNNTFKKDFLTSIYFNFPYGYYAKEINGTLSSNLYTLSQMKTEVTSSNTPTTWVPAYSVTYDKNSGDTITGIPNPS